MASSRTFARAYVRVFELTHHATGFAFMRARVVCVCVGSIDTYGTEPRFRPLRRAQTVTVQPCVTAQLLALGHVAIAGLRYLT